MNFDGTLIMKNGTKIPVTIDYIETTADTFPKFEGRITGTAKVSYRSLGDIRNDAEVNKYCYNDVIAARDFLNSIYGMSSSDKFGADLHVPIHTNGFNGSLRIPEIKNVIFNNPATIVFWEDGTKTVVKCQDGDEFDPEKGLAMAIVKKACGNKGSYCNKLKKWLPKEEQVDTNPIFTIDPKVISDTFNIIFKGIKCASNDNSVSSKKCMTFREEAVKLHPEKVDPIYVGGVFGCPRDIETCPYLGACERNCRACWDREIPDELMDND